MRRTLRPIRFQRAWSLLEILVGIVILSTLFMLTISGFHRVQKSFGHARCVSNLRTLGNAVFAFSSDNEGLIPPAFLRRHPDNLGGSRYWPSQLTRKTYILPEVLEPTGPGPGGMMIGGQMEGSIVGSVFTNPAFYCPSSNTPDYKAISSSSLWHRIYGYVVWGIHGGPDNWHYKRIQSIQDPARFPLIGDSVQNHDSALGGFPTYALGGGTNASERNRYRAARRHSGKANFFFADGHVESLNDVAIDAMNDQINSLGIYKFGISYSDPEN